MTLSCSLSISCSFARNKFKKQNVPLHTEGSWLQKLWEGLSWSSGTWIPRASLWGLGIGGRGKVNHLVLDHIRGCWSCHFTHWLLGERCQNLKVGEAGLVYNMCTDGIVLQPSNVWKGASHLTPNSGCFLRTQTLTERVQNAHFIRIRCPLWRHRNCHFDLSSFV